MKIEVQNVTKRIKKNTVLEQVSICMESGNIYGLSGANGSGKTMLMRAICGLIHPTDGKVMIDGKELGREISFPPKTGLLLENPSFLPHYTGFMNLKLLAGIRGEADDEQLREALCKVGLDPDDKRKYRKYSLGMKQRLGIANTFAENQELIILDEPFNALDEDGIRQISDLIIKLRTEGKLIILSCHDKEQMKQIADLIFVVKEGRVQLLQEGRSAS